MCKRILLLSSRMRLYTYVKLISAFAFILRLCKQLYLFVVPTQQNRLLSSLAQEQLKIYFDIKSVVRLDCVGCRIILYK